jgi:Tfp pilus assembly protein PilO
MRRFVALGILGALLLAVAWWFFFIQPRQHRIAEEEENLRDAQRVYDEKVIELALLQEIDERGVELQAEIAKLESLIPETPDLAALIDEIDEIATVSGVDVQSMSPAVPTQITESELRRITITLTIDADYYSIVDFLSRIIDTEDTERLIRVDGVALSAYQSEYDQTRLSASVTIQAFTRSDLLTFGEPIPLDGGLGTPDGTDIPGDTTPEAGDQEAT